MEIRNLFSQFGTLQLTLGLVSFLGVFALFAVLLPSEPLELSRLEEVPAGEEVPVVIQGEAGAPVELKLETLEGEDFKKTLNLDEDGQIQALLPGEYLEQAGEYTLKVDYGRHLGSSAVNEKFTVVASNASAEYSQVQLSSNALSPEIPTLLRVLLLDAFKNPVAGHTVQVSASDPSLQITTTEFVTNEDGLMNFSIQGAAQGATATPVQFQFYDATVGQAILSPIQVASAPSSSTTDVVLASESGPIEDFVVTGLDENTLTGDTQSVTVRAVDGDGFTVTDYTGTIRFSSSDDQATLPNDYTFLSDDLGEHQFSLGVKFVTPGAQTLTVTDVDRTSIHGEATTTVSAQNSSNSTPEYDSDFQTTDFQREGDFSLVSPVSGSYSSSTVEIQGEAEYGYHAVIFLNGEEAGRAEIQFDNTFTYTLEDLKDGTYELYVEIQSEDQTIQESSKTERLVIDTSAPELVSATLDSSAVLAGDSLNLTVLTEADLSEVSAVLDGQVFPLQATSTPGKYQGALIAPQKAGSMEVDLLLADALGNEAQYRHQVNFTVTLETTEAPAPAPETVEPPAPLLPSPVVGLMLTEGEGKIALSWEAADSGVGIAYYRIYYGPYADALYAVTETFDSSTQWSIGNLEGGVPYYFSVAAVDLEGQEGPHSPAVMGKPEFVIEVPAVEVPPVYPVHDNLNAQVPRTPDTGPAGSALLILSGLGASAWIFFRKS